VRVLLAELGIKVPKGEIQQGREFALRAEQKGILQVSMPPRIRDFIGQFKAARVRLSADFRLDGVGGPSGCHSLLAAGLKGRP
jgi:hypothetical protein